jgi:hypothetical protein
MPFKKLVQDLIQNHLGGDLIVVNLGTYNANNALGVVEGVGRIRWMSSVN